MGFKRTITLLISVFSAFLVVFGQAQTKSQVPPFKVISHQKNISSLTDKELEEIILGERNFWPDGERVILVLHKSKTKGCKNTADHFFSGSTMSLQKHWLSLVFQGRAQIPPVFIATEEGIIQYVAENEGTIALIYQQPKEEVFEIKILSQ